MARCVLSSFVFVSFGIVCFFAGQASSAEPPPPAVASQAKPESSQKDAEPDEQLVLSLGTLAKDWQKRFDYGNFRAGLGKRSSLDAANDVLSEIQESKRTPTIDKANFFLGLGKRYDLQNFLVGLGKRMGYEQVKRPAAPSVEQSKPSYDTYNFMTGLGRK